MGFSLYWQPAIVIFFLHWQKNFFFFFLAKLEISYATSQQCRRLQQLQF